MINYKKSWRIDNCRKENIERGNKEKKMWSKTYIIKINKVCNETMNKATKMIKESKLYSWKDHWGGIDGNNTRNNFIQTCMRMVSKTYSIMYGQ